MFEAVHAPVATYVAFDTLLEHHVVALAPPEFDETRCLAPCPKRWDDCSVVAAGIPALPDLELDSH